MIEVGAAGGAVEDARSVHLEDRLVSLNEDGSWLLSNSGLHLGDIVCIDVRVVSSVDGSRLRDIIDASSIFGGVGIGILCLSLMGFPVSEGLILPAATASVVTEASGLRGAIDKLLLGERNKVSRLEEVFAFESTSGGEGPAGATLSLILDRGDSTGGSPVDGRGVGLWKNRWLTLDVLEGSGKLGFFIVGPIRELVVTKCE